LYVLLTSALLGDAMGFDTVIGKVIDAKVIPTHAMVYLLTSSKILFSRRGDQGLLLLGALKYAAEA
jgi:hypothetical protein